VKKLHLYFLLGLVALSACSSSNRKTGTYKIAMVPSTSGQHGIYLMNSDRTGGKLIHPDGTAQLRASSCSPDGNKIAFFATHDEDLAIIRKYRMPLHFPLYLMDITGKNHKRLLDFPVSSFEWSPDSKQLLFISAYEDPERDNPEIQKGLRAPMSAAYILDLATATRKRVTEFGQNCSGSWSPDGKHLALSFGDAQSSDIYNASLTGKNSLRISDTPGINLKPVWSPNGKRIAYVSFIVQNQEMISQAFLIDPDGKNKKQIGSGNPYEVSWSVDGKIVLLRTVKGFTLASAEEDNSVELKNIVIQPQDAVFTPDGKEVMFRSNEDGPWYLFVADLKGGNIRRISGNLSVDTFCLSPIRH
jgi:Tol biopolymer transport system component